MNTEAAHTLWHLRLAHSNDDILKMCQHKVSGIPHLKPRNTIDSCASCDGAKLTKVSFFKSKIPADVKTSTTAKPFQYLSADWGFIVQKSKNMDRYKRLMALNGDTCYLVLQCYQSNYVVGVTSDTKEAPLQWLHVFLMKVAPPKRDSTVPHRIVRFDQDGDCEELASLFNQFGYFIETTGPENSRANGKSERFHRTVKSAIRAMLDSAGLSMKMWNYAFYHFIRIYNTTPRGSNNAVPYTTITKKKYDHANTRIFGCIITALKTGKRPAIDAHHRTGRFLGFDHSTRKFLYLVGKKVLTTVHASFNESFDSLAKLPPAGIALRRALGRDITLDPSARRPLECTEMLDVLANNEQFAHVFSYELQPDQSTHNNHGLVLLCDEETRRAYISDVLPHSISRRVKNWRRVLIGNFVTRVGNTIVFSKDDAESALHEACDAGVPFEVTVCTDNLDPLPTKRIQHAIPRIHMDQLQFVTSILHDVTAKLGEDMMLKCIHSITDGVDMDCLADVSNLEVGEDCLRDAHFMVSILATSASKSFGQTSKGSQFTRAQLKSSPEWSRWQEAEHKQLDDMAKDNMFGKIMQRCDIEGVIDIIRPVWSYVHKLLQDRIKARFCGNGRPLKPKTKMEQKVYTACTMMVSIRILAATAAYEGLELRAADSINAYAQSGPLDKTCYMVVDDAFREWYYARRGIFLPRGSLVELLSSIQGHPDAGPNWQRKIDGHLEEMKWKSTTHEPCFYRRVLPTYDQLMVRQIDDKLFAIRNEKEFKSIVTEMKKFVNIEGEPDLCTGYNGIEICQTRHYILLYMPKYIDKIMSNHGWENNHYSKRVKAPLAEQLAKDIMDAGKGPVTNTPEWMKLQHDAGFSYRQLLGEMIFACVTVRLDIAYALSLLSRYAAFPAKVHYLGLKSVARYLRETREQGLLYWRKEPLLHLPEGPLVPMTVPTDSIYTYPKDPYLIFADVDSSHANDLESRRSTGGHLIMYLGCAIHWVSKLMPTVATSSTEAEFMQAVMAGKNIKWIRHILNGIGRKQVGPSPIHEDNKAAIMMVNQQRPTTRTRHIDTQWFAIQQWKKLGDIVMEYINTKDNPSDALTKALGAVLHGRHACRSMGMYGSPYATGIGNLKL